MPVEVGGNTPVTRRARGLADIAPQYVAKSGLCAATEMETSRGGSIRIQHLTAANSGSPSEGRSRFPKLDECAHFHYEQVELGSFQVCLYDEELKPLSCEDSENKWWHVSVTSLGKSWVLRRSYDNFRFLDHQLHRCIYDRKFSGLSELPPEDNLQGANSEDTVKKLLTEYLTRFSQISGNTINCGPVLNWLELDNRGRRLLVPDGDNCPINTPAVAAAYAVKRYTAQAGDEISFEVGDMISVIDMPPPEESVWWRGKQRFQVGFFPCDCVAVIGDKVPRNLPLPGSPNQASQPSKPVLRKHGKLIAFFRSFILSRPSRRRLKQSGILRERVFGCDLGEHLLNSGHEIPMVLKCCAEFIEAHGIVDGIYRLSGVTSNIQKLRNAFDEDRVPALYEDEAILQDIHSVASLLKMYFRELPNPLCTYQLYHTFVNAVQTSQGEGYRLLRMRDAVQKLPPPHYRTLEYLMRHLARVAERGHLTGMTPRNVAIVWAPNLLRCKELEVGGVAALQGVGVQAVVTEFLVCYTDLIFCDNLPPIALPHEVTPKRSRPKSLAISTPTKLLSLEEARTRALMSSGKGEQDYIEVGGGPSNLPSKYHTVIELPCTTRKRSGSKRSPLGWKSFFSKSGRKSSNASRKASTPSDLGLKQEKAITESDLAQGSRRLRPVKSAESLASGVNSSRNSATLDQTELCSPDDSLSPSHAISKSSGHSRSVSHDSYFDNLAETPAHTCSIIRPSRLQEEDNEDHFSSSLDLSEIQLNFDLEESEMRIFSEDETLVSTSLGSGSLMSQGSPRIGLPLRNKQQHGIGSKRVPARELPPPRARPEDPLSGCPSTDPSPKKQKTCSSSSPISSRSKRTKLEEQLACSPADIRYIDSQSPDNQLLVQVEVHAQYEKEIARTTSPSPGDITISDNESLTMHSSGLTTPDTPLRLYAPLLEDESNSSNTTPDYENIKMTPSPSVTPGNKYELLGSPSPLVTPNIEKQSGIFMDSEAGKESAKYIDLETTPINHSENSNNIWNLNSLPTYINFSVSSGSESTVLSPPQNHLITIKYENVITETKSKSTHSEDYEIVNEQDLTKNVNTVNHPVYEQMENPLYSEMKLSEETTNAEVKNEHGIYENLPISCNVEEDHLYEDVNLITQAQDKTVEPEESKQQSTEVYQQVKYLRQSIHEVNQFLNSQESKELKSIAGFDNGITEIKKDIEGCDLQNDSSKNSIVSDLSMDQDVIKRDNIADQHCMNFELLLGKRISSCDSDSQQNKHIQNVNICDISGTNSDRTDTNLSKHEKDISDDPLSDVKTPPKESTPESQLSESSFPFDSSSKTINCLNSEMHSNSNVAPLYWQLERRMSIPNCQLQLSSPERHSSASSLGSPVEASRRKLESEIGREIVRERKFKQELELIRTATQGNVNASLQKQPPKQSSKHSVKELLSKFETSPTEVPAEYSINEEQNASKNNNLMLQFDPTNSHTSTDIKNHPLVTFTPKLSRRSDPNPKTYSGSLPPCIRARAAKAARNAFANSMSLSVSLDEDQFMSSTQKKDNLVRVQTSPDINFEQDSGKHKKENMFIDKTAEQLIQNSIDVNDPQRRERIEKYKEERRMFLREKYRSESFRGEKDEVLQRLKQKVNKVTSPTNELLDINSTCSSDKQNSNNIPVNDNKIDKQSYKIPDVTDMPAQGSKEHKFVRNTSSSEFNDQLKEKCKYKIGNVDNDFSVNEVKSKSEIVEISSKLNLKKVHKLNNAVNQTVEPEKIPESSGFDVAKSSQFERGNALRSPKSPTDDLLQSTKASLQSPLKTDWALSSTVFSTEKSTEKCDMRVSSSSKVRHSLCSEVLNENRLPSKVMTIKRKPFENLSEGKLSSKEFYDQTIKPGMKDIELKLRSKCSPADKHSSENSLKKSSFETVTSGSFDSQKKQSSLSSVDTNTEENSCLKKSSEGNKISPSFCIRDMAALFENRDIGNTPANRTSGKQYMSSV